MLEISYEVLHELFIRKLYGSPPSILTYSLLVSASIFILLRQYRISQHPYVVLETLCKVTATILLRQSVLNDVNFRASGIVGYQQQTSRHHLHARYPEVFSLHSVNGMGGLLEDPENLVEWLVDEECDMALDKKHDYFQAELFSLILHVL